MIARLFEAGDFAAIIDRRRHLPVLLPDTKPKRQLSARERDIITKSR